MESTRCKSIRNALNVDTDKRFILLTECKQYFARRTSLNHGVKCDYLGSVSCAEPAHERKYPILRGRGKKKIIIITLRAKKRPPSDFRTSRVGLTSRLFFREVFFQNILGFFFSLLLLTIFYNVTRDEGAAAAGDSDTVS